MDYFWRRTPLSHLSCLDAISLLQVGGYLCSGTRVYLMLFPVLDMGSESVFCSIEKIKGNIWLKKF